MNKSIHLVFLVLISISFFLSLNVLFLARSERVYQVLALGAKHEQLSETDRIQLGSHIQRALLEKSSIQFHSSQGLELFNTKEVIHMLDVANLLQKVFFWMLFSAILLLLGIKSSSPLSYLLCKKIGLYTLGSLILSGLLLFLFFSPLFHFFHLFSFSNDFWLLDPRTDFLIRLFPFSFFQLALGWILLSSMLLSLLFWLGIPKLRTIIRL
jgi:integral membrane protein (TIGR01906 family)